MKVLSVGYNFLMTKDILIKMPLVNQRKDTGDKRWASRSCAICSLKMMLDFSGLKPPSVQKLIKEGVKRDGYIKGVGWRHKTLADIAEKYGLGVSFIKRFPKTASEKLNKIRLVHRQIAKGNPVIASVFYKFNPKNGGHMVLIRGTREKDGKVIGYHVQDPDPGFKGHNYYVPKDVFMKNWRGGLVYLK